MSTAKRQMFKEMEQEEALLDHEFAKEHPELIEEGWTREDWESYQWCLRGK